MVGVDVLNIERLAWFNGGIWSWVSFSSAMSVSFIGVWSRSRFFFSCRVSGCRRLNAYCMSCNDNSNDFRLMASSSYLLSVFVRDSFNVSGGSQTRQFNRRKRGTSGGQFRAGSADEVAGVRGGSSPSVQGSGGRGIAGFP